MPYNNAPIAPPEEVTGTSRIPLARVKKIIAQDEDIAQCSNSAAFAISVATEIFLRHLTEQAHNVVKSERKPRRNIAYKDIATAVSRIDNLEFLSDVVPRTQTYRQYKAEKAQEEADKAAAGVNGDRPGSSSRNIADMMQQPANTVNGDHGVNGGSHAHSPITDRTIRHTHPDPIRDLDVNMSG
jgi:DNA polymerase epsilon subunit 4